MKTPLKMILILIMVTSMSKARKCYVSYCKNKTDKQIEESPGKGSNNNFNWQVQKFCMQLMKLINLIFAIEK